MKLHGHRGCRLPSSRSAAPTGQNEARLLAPHLANQQKRARSHSLFYQPAMAVYERPVHETIHEALDVEFVDHCKRVSASIWILLHAASCRDGACAVAGCHAAKALLTHMWDCGALAGDTKCEVAVCRKAAGLLQHYAECRHARESAAAAGAPSRNVSTKSVAEPYMQ